MIKSVFTLILGLSGEKKSQAVAAFSIHQANCSVPKIYDESPASQKLCLLVAK